MKGIINHVSIYSDTNMADSRDAWIVPAVLGGEPSCLEYLYSTEPSQQINETRRRSQQSSEAAMLESGFVDADTNSVS